MYIAVLRILCFGGSKDHLFHTTFLDLRYFELRDIFTVTQGDTTRAAIAVFFYEYSVTVLHFAKKQRLLN